MITVRKSSERGHFDFGWLDTHHTFSFGEYSDPAHMGFRALRVINEDSVRPGEGFPTHGHRDMEILTWILDGALQHKDSLGTGSVIRPGELQRMSAGKGVRHSEFNASKAENVHFLQIWVLPEKSGLEPSYEQRAFAPAERKDRLQLLASHDAREGSVLVQQDVDLYAATLSAGRDLELPLRPGRHAWVQVARGGVEVNGQRLSAGDGAAVSDERELRLRALEPAEVLVFDLA